MSQANFAYASPANDAAGLPVSLSIYADRAHLRGTIRDGELSQMTMWRLAQMIRSAVDAGASAVVG